MTTMSGKPIGADDRERTMGQHAHVFWLTGLSGSGKSTLAVLLENALQEKGFRTMLLDGDVLRQGLNSDLGFTASDRQENIRRTGHLNRVLFDAGLIIINAFISPFESDRRMVRSLFPTDRFSEVYIKADLAVCESRDPKGMYRRARAGELKEFTGIDAPYEAPLQAELVIETGSYSKEVSLEQLINFALIRLK